MSALTPKQRRADRALCDAATPPPWVTCPHPVSGIRVETPSDAPIVDGDGKTWRGVGVGGFDRDEDAAFIARARDGWPACLDALDALDAAEAALRQIPEVREALDTLRMRPLLAAAEEQVAEMLDANAAQAAEVARLRALLARVPHLMPLDARSAAPRMILTHPDDPADNAECARLGGACAMADGKEAPR